jgi:hypothetical protein
MIKWSLKFLYFINLSFAFNLIFTDACIAETLQTQVPDRSDWQNFVLTEEALYTPERIWANSSLGVSYRVLGQKRFSAVAQVGYRINRSGPYLHLEHSRIHNFATMQNLLTISNIGIGYENLWLLGILRTSFSLGASILNTKTDVDTAGTWGYFLDIRPVDIRFSMKHNFVVFFAPLGFNVSIPVPNGIPLFLIHHQITTGIEKTF